MATPATAQTTATATAANQQNITDRERLANEKSRGLNNVAAHELGHVIGHIVTEMHFSYVWVAGVNEQSDKFYQDKDPLKHVGGHVRSYRWGKMTFDGKRVKCINQDADAEDWLVTLLAGIAGEEVFAGGERPRSVIELSHDYRIWEGRSGKAGDFQQAQKWVKRGVENGYFHAKEVWAVLQHYYNKAFSTVRSHKAFLLATVPLLVSKGVMYNTEVLTLWNGFYQIEPTKKASKNKASLDIKDNAQEENAMQLTELETFVLHDLSTRKVNGYIKDDQLQTYYGNFGVGGYYRFAYVHGRRYDVRGLAKKFDSILYLLQRTGLVNVNNDKNVVATLPEGILPPLATTEVWKKDMTTVIDGFKKTVTAEDTPNKQLSVSDIEHVVVGSPVQDAELSEAFDDLAATVKAINALRHEENSVRKAADILGRDISSIKDEYQLRQRFVLELSAPALKAAAVRVRKDCPTKPEKWDKMKKKEREACGWTSYAEKTVNDILAAAQDGTLADNCSMLFQLSYYLKAESAHAAWRVEAARRHPDQGGSTEASATFGAVWERVEKMFPKANTLTAAA
jgi:hypothetical protein